MGIPISSDGWYAIRVKSNRERITAVGLSGKGFEVFLPEYGRPRGARRGAERVVLFPGYVFGRFDPSNRLPILTLPGVIHIVCAGKTPAPVDATELESLQVLLQAGLPINPDEQYAVGEGVKIDSGPLAGARGVVVGEDNRRLLVSITLLQRSVSVALPREWVCKVTTPHGGGIFAAQESAYDR
ncbi:MAG: transcription termination/antitermination NusG family protein [Candidatus Sulfopaludibacter sp.]|nr:transcription termination/antitermination NusG family protein [Candidatus Sulfopaludibacter sp.]